MTADEFAIARNPQVGPQLGGRRSVRSCPRRSSRARWSCRARAACTARRSPSTPSRSSSRCGASSIRPCSGRPRASGRRPSCRRSRRARARRHASCVVVGLGTIGERVATMASGLGMRVTAVRRHVNAPAPAGLTRIAGPEDLPEMLARRRRRRPRAAHDRGDARPDWRRGARADEVRRRLLVNVARGRLIDEDALADALERGQIGAAGLDAFRVEPLPPDHRALGPAERPHHAAQRVIYGRLLDARGRSLPRERRALSRAAIRSSTSWTRRVGIDGLRTLADLPFFATGRFPRPELIGRRGQRRHRVDERARDSSSASAISASVWPRSG